MAAQRTKLVVGIFLFFGIGIAVITFIWLGMSHYLEKGRYYCIYFNESVQGLEIDSPVKYRGVPIGRVVKIEVAPDSKLIEVVVQIDKEQTLDKNIVAQLSVVGITGSMFIELDLKKPNEPNRTPVLTFPSKYPIIPSKPSSISQILEGLDDFLNQMRAIDLEGISDKIKETLDNVNRMMADANVKGLSAKLGASLEDIQTIVDRKRWNRILSSVEEAMNSLDSVMAKANGSIGRVDNSLASIQKLVDEKEKTVEKAIDDFRKAMGKVNILLDNGNSMVTGADASVNQIGQNLIEATRNLKQATDDLNRVMEMISDQPSQVLFGEPPAPRKIEK